MKIPIRRRRAALAFVLAVVCLPATAQWARLERDLTPVGAERAGNAAGTIPPWTGGLPTTPIDPAVGYLDPFASDAVRFTITAANAEQYREQLSAGHLALLARNPQTFRLNVYPTRRSAAYPPSVIAEIAKQAPLARSTNDEIFDVGRSSVPFPIPGKAVEIMWNHVLRWRGGSVSRMYTWFPVAGTGRYFTVRVLENQAFDQHGYMADTRPNRLVNLLGLYLSPGRVEGAMTLSWEPVNSIAESRATWNYEPLTRRVRRSPSQAYDFIDPTTDGLRTSDQYDGWNGAPDRYDWKLVGKREMFIGYNSYRLSDRKLRYADILQPGHVNPDYLRYELHRVWVVEATLRPGAVHRFPRRIFYVDEDTWQVAMEEVYDTEGRLWRFGDHQTMQFYDVPTPWYRATIHYDLRRNAYLVTYLDNQENFTRRWGWMGDLDDFMPSTLRRLAVR